MRYKTHTLRKGRFSETGRIYLVTVVTSARRARFADWCTARPLIGALQAADQEGHTYTHAWVAMPDHVHWLFSLQCEDLGTVVGRMKSRSTVAYNQATGATGPLWQKGYHDRALRTDEPLLNVARYVIANPVRAGLVTRAGDYSLWDACWL